VNSITVSLSAEQIRTKPLDLFKEAKSAVDLTQAPLIVAIGRGIQSSRKYSASRGAGESLGGEIAASRPFAMKAGSRWSGRSAVPPDGRAKIVLALGISGAFSMSSA